MIGANFALAIMHWPDPHAQMVYRKIMLVIYLVTLLVYILIFLNNERGDRISIYSSTFMVLP